MHTLPNMITIRDWHIILTFDNGSSPNGLFASIPKNAVYASGNMGSVTFGMPSRLPRYFSSAMLVSKSGCR